MNFLPFTVFVTLLCFMTVSVSCWQYGPSTVPNIAAPQMVSTGSFIFDKATPRIALNGSISSVTFYVKSAATTSSQQCTIIGQGFEPVAHSTLGSNGFVFPNQPPFMLVTEKNSIPHDGKFHPLVFHHSQIIFEGGKPLFVGPNNFVAVSLCAAFEFGAVNGQSRFLDNPAYDYDHVVKFEKVLSQTPYVSFDIQPFPVIHHSAHGSINSAESESSLPSDAGNSNVSPVFKRLRNSFASVHVVVEV